jgi:antitoxin component YwqK of YwqJK toxin-antitoxin module
MKPKIYLALGVAVLATFGCQNNKKKQHADVVSERYIHKYGYGVSREEWLSNDYPGQVITTLKNGITVSAAYESGVLHGDTSYTFPHSQTLESLHTYEKGNLAKKVTFDVRGMPFREESYISPMHVRSKYWYNTGTPKCVEETVDNDLIEGEYFTMKNELESRVSDGYGERSVRDKHGVLCAKEQIDKGQVSKRESFHNNGSPHVVLSFDEGLVHGEKRVFAETGEPLSVEHFTYGKLDGICTYYQNGVKYLEINYDDGLKRGVERHFMDGESLSYETHWTNNMKHGPSTYYFDGIAKVEWFYNDMKVSQHKFEELVEREKMIMIMHERSRAKSHNLYGEE